MPQENKGKTSIIKIQLGLSNKDVGVIIMDKKLAVVKRKRIYAREEVCIGCKLCEVHCITAHSQYKDDIVKAYKLSPVRPKSGIIVEEQKPISFGLQCRHCEDPKCVKSCITGAMTKDPETGIVTNDKERCIGCWTCILACPYGAIVRDYDEKKVASKCDFCVGTGCEPACVKNCPNQALYIDDINEACYDESETGGEKK